jgi:plastocyanin
MRFWAKDGLMFKVDSSIPFNGGKMAFKVGLKCRVLLCGVVIALLGGFSVRRAQATWPAAEQSYSATKPSNGGTIAGKILYSGKPVKPKTFPVTQDVSACGKIKEVDPVKMEGGGVAEAVVWIDDINSGKAFDFAEPALDQKKCEFVPHIVLMQPGTLKVTSSDPASHNIHVFSSANREVNQVMPPQGAPVEVTLARPDQVKIVCEIHKWMSAYVVVAKNPYYVLSGTGGAYSLGDVPPGKYHIKVWQETLGTQTQEVTVEAGKTAAVDITLGSK